MQFTLLAALLIQMYSASAQIIHFGFWKTPADACSGSPAIGTVCSSGSIYAGTFDGGSYMTTPGNCTDSATPTCDGSTDSLSKLWRGSSGSNADIPIENFTSYTQTSSSSYRGDVTTAAIVAHASISSDSAADYCNDMVYAGYSDWVLPSKSELSYLYCKATVSGGAHDTSKPHEDVNCVSVGGKTSEVPGFVADWYWSSTEAQNSEAWKQNFTSGSQYRRDKYHNRYVRCVRRY